MVGNDERSMLLFAQLAKVAALKQQPIGRDRFLVLTGISATRAGWPDVATRCHELIVANSHQHIVGRFTSFADALRDEDFQIFVKQIEKFCTPERGEHLLSEIRMLPLSVSETQSAGDICQNCLESIPSDHDA